MRRGKVIHTLEAFGSELAIKILRKKRRDKAVIPSSAARKKPYPLNRKTY
jgi:hypothetical protein